MKNIASLLLPFSLLHGACITTPEDGMGVGSADQRKHTVVRIAATCDEGKPSHISDAEGTSAINVAGNILAFDTRTNCADEIQACLVGNINVLGQTEIRVVDVGAHNARCATEQRVYVDLTELGGAIVDRTGKRTNVKLSINDDAATDFVDWEMDFEADVYGSAEVEIQQAIARHLEGTTLADSRWPEVIGSAPRSSARVTEESIAELLSFPLSQVGIELLSAQDARQALSNVRDAAAAATDDTEWLEKMWRDVADIANARLTNMRLANVRSGRTTWQYVVGATQARELISIQLPE